MFKGKGYRKLGRTSSQRKALLRDLTTELIIQGRIETTVSRAKEIRKTTDKMITLGKKGGHDAYVKANAFMRNVKVENSEGETVRSVDMLFNEVAPKYENRNGGYTSIIKKGPRRGDGAEMAIIQLVEGE